MPHTKSDRKRHSRFHLGLILLSASLAYFVSGVLFNTQGLLYPELVEEFQRGEVATAWVIGVRGGACQISALLCCWLVDMFEYRTLSFFGSFLAAVGVASSAFINNFDLFFVTHGIITGIGMGFQYVPALLVPQIWFDKRRTLAIAVTVSGSPIASFLYSPILQLLINTYGWRGAVLITAAVCFNGCAFALMLNPPPKVEHQTVHPKKNDLGSMGSIMLHSIHRLNDSNVANENGNSTKLKTVSRKLKTLFDISELRKSGTILCSVFLLWILFCLGFPNFFNFLPFVASTYGISKETVSFILSIYGVTQFFGRLACGILGSVFKNDSVLVWCFVSIGGGIAYICSTWAKSAQALYAVAALCGVFNGGWFTYSSVALVDLFGIDQVAKSYGLMQIAQSFAFFTSSTLHAGFAEATGRAEMIFLLAGALQFVGGLVLLVHYLVKRHRDKKVTSEVFVIGK